MNNWKYWKMRSKYALLLLFIWCSCLHEVNSSEQQQQYELQHQQQQYNKEVARRHESAARKRHQYEQRNHYNRKYQQQHQNYKNQIQQQRRITHHKKQTTYHRKQPVYHRKQPVYHYKGKKYHYKKRKYNYIKWPRIRGRCKYSPWSIEGVNPVMEEAAKGNIVLLYMLKANDPYSHSQLVKMNDLAEHYRDVGKKVTLIALNHRSRTIPQSYKTRFRFVKILQEPAAKSIFTQLRAGYRYSIIYDKCGRQQYHFAPPYSWLGYDITRQAIDNVRRFYTDYNMCGVCKPQPKTTTPAPGNYTTLPITTKPSDAPVDGPYTNIPIALKKSLV